MKYIILILTALFLCGAQNAVDQQHLPHYNMIQNPGFENGKAKWTASGSSTFTLDTSTQLFGTTSAKWDASAGSETFSSNPQTVPEGLETRGCIGLIHYRWSGGTAGDIELRVVDGSSNVLASSDIPVSSETAQWFVAFNCPSGSTLTLQIFSTANAAEVTIDDTWIGDNIKAGTIVQAERWGTKSWEPTTNCIWIKSSADWNDFSNDVDCDDNARTFTENAIADASNDGQLPQIRFSSLGPGKYRVLVQGSHRSVYSASSTSCNWAISDGTTRKDLVRITSFSATDGNYISSLETWFDYDSGQGDTTFKLLAYRDGGGDCYSYASDTQLQISVYRFPTSSEKAVSLETQGMYWEGHHDTDCDWQKSGSSYGNFPIDSSCTLVELHNSNFGTVTSANDGTPGNNYPGITFTPRRVGTYEICAESTLFDSGGNIAVAVIMTDGSVVIDETRQATVDAAEDIPFTMCGFYEISALTERTIRLEAKAASGNVKVAWAAGLQYYPLKWTIKPITQNFPQAVVLPVVTSYVRLDTGSGVGDGSHSAIRDLTNVTSKAGTCIDENVTSGDSDTDGVELTILCDGIYSGHYADYDSTGTRHIGFSLNSTNLTTAVNSLTAGEKIIFASCEANVRCVASFTLPLSTGDVIRTHVGSSAPNGASDSDQVILTRVH